MIKITLQFNGKTLTLPVNPEQLAINRSASNSDIDIIGLGRATRKGEPGLAGLTIDSFFPGSNSYYYTGTSPRACIEFIEEIWYAENTNNNVGRLITLGLPIDLNIYFVIDSFEYDHNAGEEDDIYYVLKIKKYVPYGVKTVNVDLTGLAAARGGSTNIPVQSTSTKNNTYTVEKNDYLWNITQAAVGDGSRWKELYDLNKSIIGSNPNQIKAGQVLTLPAGWSVPANSVKKLTNVKKSTVNSYSNTVTDTSNIPIQRRILPPVTSKFYPAYASGGAGGGGGR